MIWCISFCNLASILKFPANLSWHFSFFIHSQWELLSDHHLLTHGTDEQKGIKEPTSAFKDCSSFSAKILFTQAFVFY